MGTEGKTHFQGTVIANVLSAGTIKGNVTDTTYASPTFTGTASASTLKVTTLLSASSFKLGATTLTASDSALLGGITVTAAVINGVAPSFTGTASASTLKVTTLLSASSFKLGATTLTASDSALLGGITVAAATINTLAKSASGGLSLMVATVTANGTASGTDGAFTVARSTAGTYAVTFDPALAAVPTYVSAVAREDAKRVMVDSIATGGFDIYGYAASSTALGDTAFSLLIING